VVIQPLTRLRLDRVSTRYLITKRLNIFDRAAPAVDGLYRNASVESGIFCTRPSRKRLNRMPSCNWKVQNLAYGTFGLSVLRTARLFAGCAGAAMAAEARSSPKT
jgi:hypothetical protein